MAKVIRITDTNGNPIEFEDEVKASGGMKDAYFSPKRDYVVLLFRDKPKPGQRERLEKITDQYRRSIFEQEGGEYLKKLYCWPYAVVEYNGHLGVVAPFYDSTFFFKFGSINNDAFGLKGKEKEGKWFASAKLRKRSVDPRELGDYSSHLKLCLQLVRSVHRMHAAGLAHSDLSYKNVLVDPTTGRACMIDIDGLVVPGRFLPEVIGTPDFIAPEVIQTQHLPSKDPNRKLPSRQTDLHALAVLIYMYLLYRHPLKGSKFHHEDTQTDMILSMGENALFIEHPTDVSNRRKASDIEERELPWADTSKVPCSVTGPYLTELFQRAFVEGLHNPAARPTADDWINALVKTVDLIQPCRNPSCLQKWFVFDNRSKPRCPFCGTSFQGALPILNLYSPGREGKFRPDNHRLMVYSGQSLFQWHANRHVFPNEKLTAAQTKRVGYFVLHNGIWFLVNENLPELQDVATKTPVPIGEKVALTEGLQLRFSKQEGGRLASVQIANA